MVYLVGRNENGFIWFVRFVSFIWLNETNQMNQINQINKTNQRDQRDQIDHPLSLRKNKQAWEDGMGSLVKGVTCTVEQ